MKRALCALAGEMVAKTARNPAATRMRCMALIIRTAVTTRCPQEPALADPSPLLGTANLGPCDAVQSDRRRDTPHLTGSKHLYNSFVSMLRSDDGATLVEYSLVVALIAVVCIAAVTSLGNKINNKLNNAANSL